MFVAPSSRRQVRAGDAAANLSVEAAGIAIPSHASRTEAGQMAAEYTRRTRPDTRTESRS